jgi:molybdopterin molybdotransferase
MESFFKLKKPDEVFDIIDQFDPVGEDVVPLEDAGGRVLSRDLTAPEDLPQFFRSTMDGYAVKAKSTFGANEGLPALFEVGGEVLMGEAPRIVVEEGRAVKIPTGGMLPEGADGVVMKEYCNLLDEETLEVSRTISPLENVIQPGDDFRKGATFLNKGHRLRPQDLGVMAGLGLSEAPVFRRPRIAIISTGDEIVPVDKPSLPGQVRDINRYTLGALCRRMGAEPICMGVCPDRFEALKEMSEKALMRADSLWISGGSSVGTRDLTLKVFETLPRFELLVHGISISPGKPTIIGKAGSQPVIGLPGHVASALVIAEVFMTRVILRLSGDPGPGSHLRIGVEAALSQNIESANGREDYIRVKLIEEGGGLTARPVFGKSGLISTLVEADGLIRIDMNTEGLYQGERVKVMLFNFAHGGLQ